MSLEQILVHVSKSFSCYTCADSRSGELDQSEMLSLVNTEFPALADATKDEEVLASVMRVMGLDGDQKVAYKEYACFVAYMSLELETFVDEAVILLHPGPTLEQIAVQMIKLFKKYSGADIKSGELQQSELAKLVKEEFPALTAKGKDEEVLASVMRMMDLTVDKLSYRQFVEFLAYLSMEIEFILYDEEPNQCNMCSSEA